MGYFQLISSWLDECTLIQFFMNVFSKPFLYFIHILNIIVILLTLKGYLSVYIKLLISDLNYCLFIELNANVKTLFVLFDKVCFFLNGNLLDILIHCAKRKNNNTIQQNFKLMLEIMLSTSCRKLGKFFLNCHKQFFEISMKYL